MMRTQASVIKNVAPSEVSCQRLPHAAATPVPTYVETAGFADYTSVPLHARAHAEMSQAPPEAEQEPEIDVAEVIPVPKDKDEAKPPNASLAAPGTHPIVTILKADRPPETLAASATSPIARLHCQVVAAGGAPATGNGSNDCLPSASTLSWAVVEADANNWRVEVQSLALAGTVNVKPWPSNPTDPAVPNTANAVEGGNITAGNWKAAIDDMADYNLANGGAGPSWHSTAASNAHEWAHWNTDWIADSVNSAAGGDWPKTNKDLDALKQPKATSTTAADAKTALQGRVNARMLTSNNAAVTRWNAIPDTAGVAGSTGYIAGAGVLATLIAAVRTFATAKGWTGPPPAPVPAPPPPPGK